MFTNAQHRGGHWAGDNSAAPGWLRGQGSLGVRPLVVGGATASSEQLGY